MKRFKLESRIRNLEFGILVSMKKLLLVPLFLVFLAAGSIFWFYQNTKPVSGDKTFSDFLIVKGSSASQIGNKMADAGLIRSPMAFKLYIRLSGKAAKIQAGEYRLSSSFTLFQTVDQLLKGPVEIWVTIPEGLRREEIALKFASSLKKDQTFVDAFLLASKGKEGMLFPDTYLFPKEATGGAVVKKMIQTFDGKTASLESAGSLTSNEILTLASLLERETKTAAERPIVAGILIKRANAGWPLQVDASVQYAVATARCGSNADCEWWKPLTKEDIAINSPFNTYKFPGFPPAPIANPGISSITSAYKPEKSDFWYYIHDDKGIIHYARTLEEHNANIRQYLGK